MSEPDHASPEPESPSASGLHPEGSTDERLSRIETTLADVISFIKGGGPPATGGEPDEAPDIKAEVRKAVREVQAADRDKAARTAEQESIKDQIGAIRAMLEKPPQEYKRATQAMGWNKP